jgi:SAM-dependent methyltransferase
MNERAMFDLLEQINSRPEPFQYYTASDLWADEHTSKQMLAYHLNGDIDVSSRNTAFIDRSAAWIVSHFGVGAGTRIADFGCGPGLYTIRLARAGADVTGIDFSKRSIEYAREAAEKEGLPIRYENRDYLEYDPDGRFDLILMIMCDFCVLSPAQRGRMLDKFSALLVPGGAVLFDAYSLNAFADRREQVSYEPNLLDGFWSADRYYGFLNVFKYEDEKVVLDKYTIIEPRRTRTVYNWLQYFDPGALTRELERKGFAIEEVLADVAGSPFDPDGAEFAVVARRK